MIKILSDYLTMDDIIETNILSAGALKCITNLFGSLSSDDYNAELIKILNTNRFMLTIDYLGNRLDRPISPLYQRMIEANSDSIINANNRLIKVIENKYLFNWNKLANAIFADYNPINNYDMTESKTINVNTDLETNSETSSNSTTENNSSTNETEVQKYAGFNSSSPVTTGETDKNGSVVEDRNESVSAENKTTTEGASLTNEQKEELTRSGNIGVTTSQQMIESEFKLREKNLLDVIYADIDEILFLDYYL